jgi:hypothetical protein
MALITKIVTLEVTFDTNQGSNPASWDWGDAMFCYDDDSEDGPDSPGQSIKVLKVEDPQ